MEATDTVQALERGQENEAVKDLQGRLQFLGFFEDRVDGFFGPSTEQAVREWQQDMGFTESGRVEPDERRRLHEETELHQYHPATGENGGYVGNVATRRRHLVPAEAGQPGDQGGNLGPGNNQTEQAARPTTGDHWQYSEDGQYYWDGHAWQPVGLEGAADDRQSPGDPAAGAQDPAGEAGGHTQYSADGQYYWDGHAWQPVVGRGEGAAPEPPRPTVDHPQASTGQAHPQGGAEGQPPAVSSDGASVSAESLGLDPSIFDGDEWTSFKEYLEQTIGADHSAVGVPA